MSPASGTCAKGGRFVVKIGAMTLQGFSGTEKRISPARQEVNRWRLRLLVPRTGCKPVRSTEAATLSGCGRYANSLPPAGICVGLKSDSFARWFQSSGPIERVNLEANTWGMCTETAYQIGSLRLPKNGRLKGQKTVWVSLPTGIGS